MAITDRWQHKDKSPKATYGQGLRYRVQVRGHAARSFRTLGEAQRYELKLKTQAATGDAGQVTMGELLDTWLAGKAGLTQSGRDACRAGASRAKQEFGHLDPREVHTHDIQAWIASMAVEPKPKRPKKVNGEWVTEPTPPPRAASKATRQKAVAALSGACEIAITLGALDRNPCDRVRLPRSNRRDPRFLTASELRQLALAAGPYRSMIMFLGVTGLRLGEACALNVGDVDVARGRVRVRQAKSGRGRDVAVPSGLVETFDLKRTKTDPLFVSSMGARIDPDHWRSRYFNVAAKLVGFPGLHPHDLRHTAASLMIQAGATVKDVQNALGHAKGSMTLDLYAHWWDRGLDDVAARMSALLED